MKIMGLLDDNDPLPKGLGEKVVAPKGEQDRPRDKYAEPLKPGVTVGPDGKWGFDPAKSKTPPAAVVVGHGPIRSTSLDTKTGRVVTRTTYFEEVEGKEPIMREVYQESLLQAEPALEKAVKREVGGEKPVFPITQTPPHDAVYEIMIKGGYNLFSKFQSGNWMLLGTNPAEAADLHYGVVSGSIHDEDILGWRPL